MKHALAILLLASWGCATTGPEREAATIRTAIDAGRLGCGLAAVKRVKLTDEERKWCAGEAP
jgi:hypothetical protein